MTFKKNQNNVEENNQKEPQSTGYTVKLIDAGIKKSTSSKLLEILSEQDLKKPNT